METRRIGRTEVRVTAIGFGCGAIGNLYRVVAEADAAAVLREAWDAGIRYFDVAPHYGRGLAEIRLGRFLAGRPRDAYTVSTKVGRVLSPSPVPIAEADGYAEPAQNAVRYDYSGDGIEASLEGSCERLGTSRVDICYVHDIGQYTHGAGNEAHMAAFLGSGYERLVRLKEAGRIGAFGLGVNETAVCLDVMDHGPIDAILLAGRLTLLDRSAEADLVGRCTKAGTSLVLGGVFNSGILATGAVPGATYDYGPAPADVVARVAALEARAEAAGLPLATAALQFAARHPATTCVLLGTAKASSLRRNLAALAEPLPVGAEAALL